MQTRNSRCRTRRTVENRACTKCPGCNNDDRKRISGSSNDTADKRKKRSASVPRRRARSRGRSRSRSTRARMTESPPTTPLGVTNQFMSSDEAASTSTSATAFSGTTRASHEIMKIDTKNYCLFCFKLCRNVLSGGDGVGEPDTARRKEVSSRFLKLLTRHLELDIYSHVASTSDLDGSLFTKTIKKDEGYFEIVACQACNSICESFCDTYHKYKQAQLELGWNVMKLKDIMKSAEKVPSRINDFRRNVLEGDGGMKRQEKELMDGFRREFYRKCNRVKGYPKVALKKLDGTHASAIKRRATVGLQRFHQTTPIDMVRNPTASIQVLELEHELILTSRARAPRSKSVPPIPIRVPALPTCETPSSPQVPAQVTPQQATPSTSSSAQAKNIPIVSKPAHVETVSKKSNLREENSTCPNPSSRKHTDPQAKNTKVIRIAKRVRPPTPHKNISTTPVIDLCDSDDEDDPQSTNSSPPKRLKTTAPVPVVVEPVVSATAPPLPNAVETPNRMEVNAEDDTGKDTGTALAGYQDDNEIVMEISSQSAPQPSEASTSHTSASLSHIPEISENPSTSCHFNLPQEPGVSSLPSTSENVNPGIIPPQMETQPAQNDDFFTPTNQFPHYSPHSHAQFEEPENTQHYENDYTDAPPEATGIFTQHEPHPQPMDFEFTPPAPGTGIEFTVDPVSNGPYRISYTYTRTVTSTISGIPPGNFGMPHSHMYPPNTSSQVPEPEHPPFYSTTQDHGYDHQFNCNDYIPEQFNAAPENYFVPNQPVDPQPIVTEVEDENNYANHDHFNEDQSQDVGIVTIAEVDDDDSNDVQVIGEVCSGTQRDFTVTMNLRNESEVNTVNNEMRTNINTVTPPVYVCT